MITYHATIFKHRRPGRLPPSGHSGGDCGSEEITPKGEGGDGGQERLAHHRELSYNGDGSVSDQNELKRHGAGACLALAGLLFACTAVAAQTGKPGLMANFTFGPKEPVEGQSVQFRDASKGDPIYWQWDFGDGASSALRNPSHVFATPGPKKVVLVVGDGSKSKRAVRTVDVAGKLSAASFTFSPTAPQPWETVRFTDTSGGRPTLRQWDFGDGTKSDAKDPRHAYAKGGTYEVTLTVADSFGSQRTARTVTVPSQPTLVPSFTCSPSVATVNQAVQFKDTTTGGPTKWRWEFGDGSGSTKKDPSHGYANTGHYTVIMTVSKGAESVTTTRTVSIVVSPPPDASFTFSPPAPVAGQAVQFKDTSANNPAYWRWDFADGETSPSKNPGHTYAEPGYYNVTLTATNAYGAHTASALVVVSATETLVADFEVIPPEPVAGQMVTYKDKSIGKAASWLWSFGDGRKSTTQSPRYAYLDPGSYEVTLTVTSGTNTSTVTKTVTVVEEERDYPGPE